MQTRRLLGLLPVLAPLCVGCRTDGAVVDTVESSGASSDSTSTATTAATTLASTESSSSLDESSTAVTTLAADSSSSETTGGSSETGAPNTPPVAVDDGYAARMDSSFVAVAFTDSVLLNDSDADGDALEVVAQLGLATAQGGTVDLSADGGFSYAPPPTWWGEDTFEYTVSDGHGGEAMATVHLAVAPTAIPLPTIAMGMGGFAIDGIASGDYSGFAVSGAGDVNGDGFADVIVSAPGASPNGTFSGRAFIVFGKADSDPVQLADVADGTGGFMLEGAAQYDFAGSAVSGAGDVNGDGLADLVIGASGAAPNGLSSAGRSYVVFGKVDTAAVSLATIESGVGGFAIDGTAADDQSGQRVGRAGDVDGDGLDDLIIGARYADPNGSRSGAAYVVFGKADTALVPLADVAAGIGGFVLEGEMSQDTAGSAVAGAGDINGDGLADLVVGAPYANGAGIWSGRGYVVFGKADTDPVSLGAVASGVGGFLLQGAAAYDNAGNAVSGAGDIDGDGLADVIIGAYRAEPMGFLSGRSYVVFGKADTDPVALADLAVGTGGFSIDGAATQDFAGQSVSGAGDMNGDGVPDVVIGSGNNGPNGSHSGQTWIVFGDGALTSVALADVDEGTGGFMLYGDAYEYAGHSVSGAGDVNGDGFADIVIGAQQASPNGGASGRAYVVFGGDFTP